LYSDEGLERIKILEAEVKELKQALEEEKYHQMEISEYDGEGWDD